MDQYTIGEDGQMTPASRITGFRPEQYQISIRELEDLTPLRFGILKDYDTGD